MIRIKAWTEKPSGQALVATLFFCFVFFALFIGLYKSGMVYSAKERATRSTDLTALSAGAVYANGLQLVRVTNAVLLAFAALDIVIIAAAIGLTGGADLSIWKAADPNFRGRVQLIQKILFGIGLPSGAYPFLIFTEGLSLASDNQLKNNWGNPAQLSWKVPLPPSPIFLFNYETSDPIQALLPNMALKFRKATVLLPNMDKAPAEKRRYHLTKKETGVKYYFKANEVEIAPNSQNPGQMRVKSADFKNRYVSLEKEVESEAEKDAEKRIKKESLMKMESALGGLTNVLDQITLDVTDNDDPPDHSLMVYSEFPNSKGGSTYIKTISEADIEGDGLAAWDLNAPKYQAQLVQVGPERLTDLLNVQARISQIANSGQIPSFSNIFNMATNGKTENNSN